MSQPAPKMFASLFYISLPVKYCLLNSTVLGEPQILHFGDCPIQRTKLEPPPQVDFHGDLTPPKVPDLRETEFSYKEGAVLHFYGPQHQEFDPVPGEYVNRLHPKLNFDKKVVMESFMDYQERWQENKSLGRDPQRYNYHFVPYSYMLPRDENNLYMEMRSESMEGRPQPYISRPFKGNSTRNVCISRDFKDVNRPGVVQRFETSVLRYKGHKLSFKLEVLVTSVDPLIAYRWSNGVVRIAGEEQQVPIDPKRLEQHVPGYDPESTVYKDLEWLFSELDEYPENFNFDTMRMKLQKPYSVFVRNELTEVLGQTLVVMYPKMLELFTPGQLYSYPKTSFEIFGADMYINILGHVKLFDFHSNPRRDPTSNNDKALPYQESLVQALNLLGIRVTPQGKGVVNPRPRLEENGCYSVDYTLEPEPPFSSPKVPNEFFVQNRRGLNLVPWRKRPGQEEVVVPLYQEFTQTALERRALAQIEDEASRAAPYVRIPFEHYLPEMFKEGRLNRAVYAELLRRQVLKEKAGRPQEQKKTTPEPEAKETQRKEKTQTKMEL